MFLFSRIKVLFTLVFIFHNLFYLQPNILLLHNIENDDAQAKPSYKKVKLSSNDEIYLWHFRLSHINQNRIERLVKDGPLNSLEVKPLPTCESCLEGKMTKRPMSKNSRMLRISTRRCLRASKCSSLGRFRILYNIHQ